MGMVPKTKRDLAFRAQTCVRCGRSLGPSEFLLTNSDFFPNHHTTICIDCLRKEGKEAGWSWDWMDHLCQLLDIPFIPSEFEKCHKENEDDVLRPYVKLVVEGKYEGLNWHDYYESYKKLKEEGVLEGEIPLLAEAKRKDLQEKWGANYDDEALKYLETLYDGVLQTQSINGALQGDQALKLCKLSYEIDCRIREGGDVDKLLSSYDKLIKAADFTPKNAKNASDFDSIGELVRWLERRGFKNPYYDGVTKDVVDETIKNIQAWNQRLYTNESGIGEEVTKRIESLKSASELENFYNLDQGDDFVDAYENAGFEGLYKDEDFEPGDGER